MSDTRLALLSLLRDDILTPWFNRQDLAVTALDDLDPLICLEDVESAIEGLISDGSLVV